MKDPINPFTSFTDLLAGFLAVIMLLLVNQLLITVQKQNELEKQTKELEQANIAQNKQVEVTGKLLDEIERKKDEINQVTKDKDEYQRRIAQLSDSASDLANKLLQATSDSYADKLRLTDTQDALEQERFKLTLVRNELVKREQEIAELKKAKEAIDNLKIDNFSICKSSDKIRCEGTQIVFVDFKFGSGKSELPQELKDKIHADSKQICDPLIRIPQVEIVIEGHTDIARSPLRHGNYELGIQRALNFREQLLKEANCNNLDNKISVASYGPNHPIIKTDEANVPENRRITLRYTYYSSAN